MRKKNRLMHAIGLAALAAAFGSSFGCQGASVRDDVVASAVSFANVQGGEYAAYVSADPNLDASSKQRRLDSVAAHRNLINDYAASIAAP